MGETKKQIRVVNQRASRVVIAREVRKEIVNDFGTKQSVLDHIDELVLEPGANIVDAARLEQFCDPKLPCAVLFDEGVLVPQDLPEPKEKTLAKAGGDLAKLEEPEALKVVQTAKSLKQLEGFAMQDGRTKVRKAMVARSEELKKADGNDADKD